jgi:hypothetical protein
MFKFISNMMRNAINEAVDKAIERLSRDKYTENIFEMITGTKKVGAINMVENVMRASQGKPPGRPLGSHIHFSPWEKLLFNPVHLWRFPTPEQVAISSSVVIGKKAKRPLEISIPIMIAAEHLAKARRSHWPKGHRWLGRPPTQESPVCSRRRGKRPRSSSANITGAVG